MYPDSYSTPPISVRTSDSLSVSCSRIHDSSLCLVCSLSSNDSLSFMLTDGPTSNELVMYGFNRARDNRVLVMTVL